MPLRIGLELPEIENKLRAKGGRGGEGRINYKFGVNMLPSPNSLYPPHNRPMNPRDKVLRQGRDFNWGTSRPRRWQANASK